MIGPVIARNTHSQAFTDAVAMAADTGQRYRVQKGRATGIWYATPLDISGRNR